MEPYNLNRILQNDFLLTLGKLFREVVLFVERSLGIVQDVLVCGIIMIFVPLTQENELSFECFQEIVLLSVPMDQRIQGRWSAQTRGHDLF